MNLLTAKQVIWVYSHLGMTKELLPQKGKCTLLVPPVTSPFKPVRITKTEHKATYGGPLYSCEIDSLEVSA